MPPESAPFLRPTVFLKVPPDIRTLSAASIFSARLQPLYSPNVPPDMDTPSALAISTPSPPNPPNLPPDMDTVFTFSNCTGDTYLPFVMDISFAFSA